MQREEELQNWTVFYWFITKWIKYTFHWCICKTVHHNPNYGCVIDPNDVKSDYRSKILEREKESMHLRPSLFHSSHALHLREISSRDHKYKQRNDNLYKNHNKQRKARKTLIPSISMACIVYKYLWIEFILFLHRIKHEFWSMIKNINELLSGITTQ